MIRITKIFGDPRNYFLRDFVYFIFFAWSKVGQVKKNLKRLGKVAWLQYKSVPQKIKVFHKKIKTKIWLKRESSHILVVQIPLMSYYLESLAVWFSENVFHLKNIESFRAQIIEKTRVGLRINSSKVKNCRNQENFRLLLLI